MFSYPLESAKILKKKRSLKKQLYANPKPRIVKNIAVLGGSTTNEIVDMLELFLLDYGIEPRFYQSQYGQYWQDAIFPPQDLLNFKPDIIFIHTTSRNITRFPFVKENENDIDSILNEQFVHFTEMWERIFDTFKCPVIQNNFEMPFYRLFGNKDFSDLRGRVNFIARLNAMFADYARNKENFFINDINYISACYGLEKWSNPFYWNMYKYALAVPAIPEFSFNLANIIKSIYGKNKKAMALDLDNTLWGGVIGDDGQEGIKLGFESSLDEAYLEFQRYIKAHKDLGIVLSVCSKNDYDNAILGLEHPNGCLKPDDFTVIKANWESKDKNILEIAEELNIFPESIVFIDDNPAERNIVKASLNEVETPELESIENYIKTIDRSGYFEITSFSDDDIKRNEMYMQNNIRERYKSKFTDYGDYLNSLEMKARIECFNSSDLQRVTQLINKSNQFNLTTKRYSVSQTEQIASDSCYVTLLGRLSDKFGDNGIVSVIIAEKKENSLHVDLWVMSCRVLKRDMELAMLDCLYEEALKQNIEIIYGYYYPTPKNALVKDFYNNLGFEQISGDENGNTTWRLNLSLYKKRNEHIIIDEKIELN